MTEGYGPVPSENRGLSRAEWPIPVQWNLQIGLAIQAINGAAWNESPGQLAIKVRITASVESATTVQEFELPYGPGTYPTIGKLFGDPFNAQTYNFCGQVLTAEVVSVAQINGGSPLLRPWRGQWSIFFLPALASAGWPSR